MEIAELFVSLGVKNSDKTISALTQVQTSLGKVVSTSLEVKAAIIGAMYALEHLMSESAARGTSLSNFNTLTGISVKELQQWQYAARQAGESNEQFANTLKSIQDKFAQLKLNKSQPEGLQLFTGIVRDFDIKKAFDDPLYFLKKAQEYAKSNVSPDIQNTVLRSFGLDDATIVALRKGVFTVENLRKAPIYGDKEVNQLNKVNIAWSNLNNKVQMFIGHLNAKHGEQLVKDVDKLTMSILKLVDSFIILSEKLKLFEKIDTIFKGWKTIFDTIILFIDKINATDKNQQEKIDKKINENPLVQFYKNPFNPFSTEENKNSDLNNDNKVLNDAIKQMNNTNYIKEIGYYLKEIFTSKNLNNESKIENQDLSNGFNQLGSILLDYIIGKSLYNQNINQLPIPKNNIIPKVVPNNQVPTNNQNTIINQNLNFQHEGKESLRIKDSIHKSVSEAWKQLSAQSQGT